ncbi:aminotransferase class III-fold pyridoxal phosphate-dependent enzyme [Cognatiyoonia sp. IB215446]|uniref:aminotransferase class III-fold pyridoxal phosphate-dependent enzyme n=1 Tax=Cognatiyoonia sp. IB215446 TaxID=3097355 RepID=UPI002A15491D|nr:aminotransferase class III-fold pyridoxal phosphate-dependent enzyme [Cognatiyoonia sp. IB215446]MDX8348125.1 aminotransferase class III-fold pyridoxal phosphate-dependent enzyme [Cognatiyoonia sp. IB215446]
MSSTSISVPQYATPRGDAYNAALAKVLAGGVHSNFRAATEPAPIRISQARGARVEDIDGNEYLDLSSAFGSLILGHGNVAFNDALARQLSTAAHIVNGVLELEAAEALHRWFGWAPVLRFGLSGTEMVSNAIRLARAYTGRSKVMRFSGHYHGSSDLLLGGQMGDDGQTHPQANGPFESDGRAEGVLERECLLVSFEDSNWSRILTEHADDLACVLLEPVCINGGGVRPDGGNVAEMVRLCRANGVLVVADEVITGVRLGSGGGQKAIGLEADMFVTGKAVSNGIPISVLAGRAEIMELYAKRRVAHGGTYNGYGLGLRAITSTLGILNKDSFATFNRIDEISAQLAETALKIAQALSVPLHINRFGAAQVFHIGAASGSSRRYGSLAATLADGQLTKMLQGAGIMMCPLCRAYPTLALTEGDIDFFADRFASVLETNQAKLSRLARAADAA